jgi:hypothetical protein
MKTNRANYTQPLVDMMTFPFTGVCGFNAWWDFLDDGYADYWPPIIRSQNHLNGDDVINTLSEGGGKWGHGMEEEIQYTKSKKYAIEHQYYISKSKTNAIGYIRNRTYNLKTSGPLCNIPTTGIPVTDTCHRIIWNEVKNNEQLRIDSLKKNTEYRVDWYSAYNLSSNGYMKSDCMTTSKKNGLWGFKLEYPDLWETIFFIGNGDFPVVWYVIHEGCNSGLAPLLSQELENSLLQIINEDTITNQETVIYPNPFENYFIVNSPIDDLLEMQTLDGKKVGIFTVYKGKNNIGLFAVSDGIYIGKLLNQRFIFKIIKQ